MKSLVLRDLRVVLMDRSRPPPPPHHEARKPSLRGRGPGAALVGGEASRRAVSASRQGLALF